MYTRLSLFSKFRPLDCTPSASTAEEHPQLLPCLRRHRQLQELVRELRRVLRDEVLGKVQPRQADEVLLRPARRLGQLGRHVHGLAVRGALDDHVEQQHRVRHEPLQPVLHLVLAGRRVLHVAVVELLDAGRQKRRQPRYQPVVLGEMREPERGPRKRRERLQHREPHASEPHLVDVPSQRLREVRRDSIYQQSRHHVRKPAWVDGPDAVGEHRRTEQLQHRHEVLHGLLLVQKHQHEFHVHLAPEIDAWRRDTPANGLRRRATERREIQERENLGGVDVVPEIDEFFRCRIAVVGSQVVKSGYSYLVASLHRHRK